MEHEEEEYHYSKVKYSGSGVLVATRLKPEQLELLDEIHSHFPSYMSRSDLIREMVFPYLRALRLAKQGKQWQGALEFGKGLTALKAIMKEAEVEANQQELDFNASVLDVPKGVPTG